MRKIAVVGSRNYPNHDEVSSFVYGLPEDTMIVSGGASGVDAVAEHEARLQKRPRAIFPARWDKYGKRAGAMRNQQIVDFADEVVAFWDGSSPGTKITIDMARRADKPVEVRTP